ncbi:rCG44810 [Rattus norvegicus]|uniref:RCG44810 n=1 Tax=Rattus norvegicus TaxID=10116 RepID=A6I571_RAT|nr:rCG44810 [Rattus norvegicus]
MLEKPDLPLQVLWLNLDNVPAKTSAGSSLWLS